MRINALHANVGKTTSENKPTVEGDALNTNQFR